MGIYPSAGAPLSDYIIEPWERNAQGFLELYLQSNPYYPFAMGEEYKHIQCGLKMKGMKTFYDTILNEGNTALHLQSFKDRDRVQMLVASMADYLALREWKLQTLEDMKSNQNHQRAIKYYSRHIIKSMRWVMQQPAYAEHIV